MYSYFHEKHSVFNTVKLGKMQLKGAASRILYYRVFDSTKFYDQSLCDDLSF